MGSERRNQKNSFGDYCAILFQGREELKIGDWDFRRGMATNCAYLSGDHETEFSSELFHMFSPHPKFYELEHKKINCLSGWETCQDLHDEDSPFQCAIDSPYFALQLVQMSLSDVEVTYTSSSRRTFTDNSKRRNRIPPTLNLTIKRSKSSRCLQSSQSSPFIRGVHQPGIRYDTKFPTLFQGIREINYEFQPTVDHKQHAEAYRNSYTETLIRNFRELHHANASMGERCQRGARINMSDGSASSKSSRQHEKRNCVTAYSKKKVCHSASSQSPVFYSDQCQTGPIVILSGTNISSNNQEFSSSASVCFLPKSTMEINTVSYRSSQHRPFGEQFTRSKVLIGESMKTGKPVREQSGDLLFLKRKDHDQGNRADYINSRNSQIVRNATAPPSHRRRASPFGRVPVRVRRSSPSIRGKRDPLGGLQGVNPFLSIAAATHTVASPFRSEASHSEEDLTRLHNNI